MPTANELNISQPGFMVFDGIATFTGNTLVGGTGITITNGNGQSGLTTTINSTAATTDLHAPRFIVASSTSGTGANFTTIAAAIASAVGTGINSTIFLQPGTYTENFTLPPGINLCAFECDALTPNVTIIGTITMTAAGVSSISGIRLQTNSAALTAVTGSANSFLILKNCFLNASNNTAITYSSAGASSAIQLYNCKGDLGTTGIAMFSHSGAGQLLMEYCRWDNSGGSTTASTQSSGTSIFTYCDLNSPITTSSTAAFAMRYSAVEPPVNNTALTVGGSGASELFFSRLSGGTASALSVGAGATLEAYNLIITSTNTNSITGSGTINYSGIFFTSGITNVMNTTTKNLRNAMSGSISFDNGTNYLSIYQVGTFVPTVIGGSTAGTVNMTTQVGRYQKVGRVVTVSIDADWTTIGTAAGQAEVNNLPFTMANITSLNSPSICTSDANPLTTVAGAVPLFQPSLNTATGKINYYLGSTGSGTAGTITATNGFNTMSIYETV